MESAKIIRLSERLKCICEMVTPGYTVADVGCDHGFVPVYLVQNGICPRVLAMDVRKGPLSMAESHIRESGFENYIETRLSDGLDNYSYGEAQILICAGMGGMLMMRILTKAGEKLGSFREMILQPQSDLYEFRKFLRGKDLIVTEERIVLEDGKYYFPMKVERKPAGYVRSAEQDPWPILSDDESEPAPDLSVELADRFGGGLIGRKDPLLYGYLTGKLAEKMTAKREIQKALSKKDSVNARKGLEETEREIFFLEKAIKLYGGGNVHIIDQR